MVVITNKMTMKLFSYQRRHWKEFQRQSSSKQLMGKPLQRTSLMISMVPTTIFQNRRKTMRKKVKISGTKLKSGERNS